VKRALFALFKGAVSKDVVSRAWRKVKADWDAWCVRSLADEDIIRLILDGTVVKTRIDKKATNISVLAAIGVRRDGQKVLLSIMNMGGESTAAWRQFLDDLDKRGLQRPELAIIDGAPGLEAALVALWGDDLAVQRCTVHKHRNLLAHAPQHMHEELSNDYRDMIYAETATEIEKRRKAFLRKWRLKCRAVADSLEEAGDRLFTFTRLDPAQWKAARTTDVIDNPRFGKIRLWSSPNARRARSHQAARSARRAFHRASGTFWDSSCHRIAELDTAKHSRMPEHAPAGHAHTVASIRRTLSSQVTAGSVDGIITGRERPCGEARRSG
jgi:transposase-like protein